MNLILHLHYLWSVQTVNSSREEVCSLIWLEKYTTCFLLNSDSGRYSWNNSHIKWLCTLQKYTLHEQSLSAAIFFFFWFICTCADNKAANSQQTSEDKTWLPCAVIHKHHTMQFSLLHQLLLAPANLTADRTSPGRKTCESGSFSLLPRKGIKNKSYFPPAPHG